MTAGAGAREASEYGMMMKQDEDEAIGYPEASQRATQFRS